MLARDTYDQEADAMLRAAEFERELAAGLPPDSIIRGLFLRTAAAYEAAAGTRRPSLRAVST
jgi:hypothetical protein